MIVFWSRASDYMLAEELKVFKGVEHRYHKAFHIPKLDEGDLLLSMGGKNLKLIQDAGMLPKGRTIHSLREVLHPIGDGLGMVTYDADIKDFDYTSYIKLQTDVNLAHRWSQTGSLSPQIGNYKWVKGFLFLAKRICERYCETGKPVRTSCDLETVGLDPFNSEKFIVSISFSIDEGESFLVHFTGVEDQPDGLSDLWDQINWLLNDDRVSLCGANLKYDLMWMRVKWGIICTNFRFDTTLVGSLLDENRSNSLNTHAKIYCPALGGYDDEFNRTQDKSRMDLVKKKDLLPYAGGDTDATLQVANRMAKKLSQSKSQTDFYTKLLHPASRAFEDMEMTGILVDVPYYQELQYEVLNVMAEKDLEAKALMPKRILTKWGDDFKLSKAKLLKDFMFTHPKGLNLKPKMFTEKTKEPSTAIDHLKLFEDVPEAAEFVGILKEWNSAKKTESTYITGFLKHLREDGYLHPSAILFRGDYGGDSNDDSGTVTGRTSFKDPAFQTLSKHTFWAKKLRQAFIAPEGYVIMNWDYSQGELRVIACVAKELRMIQAYIDGIDMHLKTGAELNGYTLQEALQLKADGDAIIKGIRQGGKAGNFGMIYGISAEGFVAYARNTYGVIVTLEESTDQLERFFEMYPALITYHKEYIKWAHESGFVQSPLGRVRHLPLINSSNWGKQSQSERQAINSPIQSCLSDLSQLALALFKKKFGYPEGCRFFAMTHDSNTAYVLRDEVDYWALEMKHIMENLPITEYFGWNPQLPFLTDCELGYNLGEMVELAEHPGKLPSEVLATI